MTQSQPCAKPLALEELIGYALRELSESEEGRVEEHFFGCALCTTRLAGVQRLGAAIRELVRAGAVQCMVTASMIEDAAAAGLRLREYRLAPNEQVACSAWPDDDLVVTRLALELAADESVDLVTEATALASGETTHRVDRDVVVDRRAGALVLVSSGSSIRSLPRSRLVLHAHVKSERGERVIGPYTLSHTPFDELGAAGPEL